MEHQSIYRYRRTVTGLVAMFLAAGCSTIHENNNLGICPDPAAALIEATTDPEQTNYDQLTDPGYLAAEQYKLAKEKMDTDGGQTLRNQIVGIGEVSCKTMKGQVYLTSEGATLSLQLREQQVQE